MSVKRRRSRAQASLADVHRALTAMLNYCRDVLEDEDASPELRLKAVTGGNQVALSLLRLLQQSEWEQRLTALEEKLARGTP